MKKFTQIFLFVFCFLILIQQTFAKNNVADRQYLFEQAKLAEKSNQFVIAINYYQTIISNNPNDVEALNALGSAQAWNHDFKQALLSFQKALQVSPNDHDALIGIVRVLFWDNQLTEAKTNLTNFFSIYPSDVAGKELQKKIKQAQKDQQFWLVDLGYTHQNFSFTNSANGGNILVSYIKNKKWSLRLGADALDKFNSFSQAMRAGASVWFKNKFVFSLDAFLAPNETIVPQQAYSFLTDYKLNSYFVFSLGYRFADYTTANSHTLSPKIQWNFNKRADLIFKYDLAFTQFAKTSDTNSNFTTRIGIRPIDLFYFYAGYAHTNESFEPGNTLTALGTFSAHHALAGLKIETKYNLNLMMDNDYEKRSLGPWVNTINIGLQKKF